MLNLWIIFIMRFTSLVHYFLCRLTKQINKIILHMIFTLTLHGTFKGINDANSKPFVISTVFI